MLPSRRRCFLTGDSAEGGRGLRGRAARWGERSSPVPESKDAMLMAECLCNMVGAAGNEILLKGKCRGASTGLASLGGSDPGNATDDAANGSH